MKNMTNLMDEASTINTQIRIGKLTFTAEELASLILLADENDTTDREPKGTVMTMNGWHDVKVMDEDTLKVIYK